MAANDKIRVQTQYAVEAGDGDGAMRVHEQYAVEAGDGDGAMRVHEQYAVYSAARAAEYVYMHEQYATLASGGSANAVIRVHEQYVVIAAGEGVFPEGTLDPHAFFYEFDGHLFYILHLGEEGTHAYDVTTGEWTQFASGDLILLNANLAMQYGSDWYAASLIDASVVRFDPESVVDDSFRVNTFLATGRIESKSRRHWGNPEAHLFGSTGLRGGAIRLRYSNDDGETWSADRTRVTPAGNREENVLYRDLGSVRAPGRLYQVEDNGALRRIQTLRVKLTNSDGS